MVVKHYGLQKGKDFFYLKSLGKEGKKAQNRKEFLGKDKGKEIQKGQERKIRELIGDLHK